MRRSVDTRQKNESRHTKATAAAAFHNGRRRSSKRVGTRRCSEAARNSQESSVYDRYPAARCATTYTLGFWCKSDRTWVFLFYIFFLTLDLANWLFSEPCFECVCFFLIKTGISIERVKKKYILISPRLIYFVPFFPSSHLHSLLIKVTKIFAEIRATLSERPLSVKIYSYYLGKNNIFPDENRSRCVTDWHAAYPFASNYIWRHDFLRIILSIFKENFSLRTFSSKVDENTSGRYRYVCYKYKLESTVFRMLIMQIRSGFYSRIRNIFSRRIFRKDFKSGLYMEVRTRISVLNKSKKVSKWGYIGLTLRTFICMCIFISSRLI